MYGVSSAHIDGLPAAPPAGSAFEWDAQLAEACQQIGRHLMNRFAEVCRREGLEFHLGGGTLLGAMRDSGFILWDDDVDVSMPRSDYETLRRLARQDPELFGCQVEFRPGHEVAQPFEIGRLYYLPSSSPEGPVHLDVFVLDPVLEGHISRTWVTRAARLLRTAMTVTATGEPEPLSGRKRLVAPVARTMGRDRLDIAYAALMRHAHRQADTLACMGRQRPRRWYSSARTSHFEGAELPVPANAEGVLQMLYGPEFMTPQHASAPHYTRPFEAELNGKRWSLQ